MKLAVRALFVVVVSSVLLAGCGRDEPPAAPPPSPAEMIQSPEPEERAAGLREIQAKYEVKP